MSILRKVFAATLPALIILAFYGFGMAQTVANPSFEGPSQTLPPPNWPGCTGSPDTQPPWWGVNLPATHGSTYLGMVYRIPSGLGSRESCSALLTTPLTAGITHTFTVDLVNLENYFSGWNGQCVAELWAGMSSCSFSQLLWSSGGLTNHTWQQFTPVFVPAANYTYIHWRVEVATGTWASIGIDNMSTITAGFDIQIADFKVLKENSSAHLFWESEMPAGTAFSVQRASDGVAFASLDVQPKQIGNNQKVREYFLKDEDPAEGINFYRLEVRHPDGSISYSTTHKVFFGPENSVQVGEIFPNPASDQAFVRLYSDRFRHIALTLYNGLGQQIHAQDFDLDEGWNQVSLDLLNVPEGIYFISPGGLSLGSSSLIVRK